MSDTTWNWCTVLLISLLVIVLTVVVIIGSCVCAMSLRRANLYPAYDYDEIPYAEGVYRGRYPYANSSRNNWRAACYHGNASHFPPFHPMPWPARPGTFFLLPFDYPGNFSGLPANHDYDAVGSAFTINNGYDLTGTGNMADVTGSGATVKEMNMKNGSGDRDESGNALCYDCEEALVDSDNLPLMGTGSVYDRDTADISNANPSSGYAYVNEGRGCPQSDEDDEPAPVGDPQNDTVFFEIDEEFLESTCGFDSMEYDTPSFTFQQIDSGDSSDAEECPVFLMGSGRYGPTSGMAYAPSCSSSATEVLVIGDDSLEEGLKTNVQSVMSTFSDSKGMDHDTALLLCEQDGRWKEDEWSYELDISSSGSLLVEDGQPSVITKRDNCQSPRVGEEGIAETLEEQQTLDSALSWPESENILLPQTQLNALQNCNAVVETEIKPNEQASYVDKGSNKTDGNLISVAEEALNHTRLPIEPQVLTASYGGDGMRAPNLICLNRQGQVVSPEDAQQGPEGTATATSDSQTRAGWDRGEYI